MCSDFFTQSGVFHGEPLNHTPLLVFVAKEDMLKFASSTRRVNCSRFPTRRPVMGQWRGEWRSDYFQLGIIPSRQVSPGAARRVRAIKG